MKNILFKLCILIVIGVCSFTKASGQVSQLKELLQKMNKACPIKVDDKTVQIGYRYEAGYVIIDNSISAAMTKKKLESIYGSPIFRKELLKAYTQLSSIKEFTQMVVDANAGLIVNYTSTSSATQTISFSPEEIRTSFYLDDNVRIEGGSTKDNVISWHNTGINYLKGGKYALAFTFFKKAAEQGFPASQTNLGLCYEQGWGTEVDYYQAEYWYKKAIESGAKKEAPLNLGGLYVSRLSKYNDAVTILNDLAKQGDVAAQCIIGMAFLRLKEYDKALYWEEKAANSGDHSAENNLGIWYLKGLFGFTLDYDKAVYWNERAAKAGKMTAKHNLRIAQFKKGEMLYNSSKFEEAFALFMKAANNTDNPIPGALRKLSDCYRYGKGTGTGPNEQKAKYYWEEAVKYNDEIAMKILGITNFD